MRGSKTDEINRIEEMNKKKNGFHRGKNKGRK